VRRSLLCTYKVELTGRSTVCWECIVGWAREKGDCPLCRQATTLNLLLPLYNL
jgi:peroxin-10